MGGRKGDGRKERCEMKGNVRKLCRMYKGEEKGREGGWKDGRDGCV